MLALREYIATFIVNTDLVDVCMLVCVVVIISILLKVFAFGLYERR